jgi:hypothetical protein
MGCMTSTEMGCFLTWHVTAAISIFLGRLFGTKKRSLGIAFALVFFVDVIIVVTMVLVLFLAFVGTFVLYFIGFVIQVPRGSSQ